ncbi:hypothetical protein [Sunxiuqinia rutila]|uniref:hypothetical protein n=1 Tax=Sunxiuqinia rutila TaxID=1397841 RepID=UPI003D35D6F3
MKTDSIHNISILTTDRQANTVCVARSNTNDKPRQTKHCQTHTATQLTKTS